MSDRSYEKLIEFATSALRHVEQLSQTKPVPQKYYERVHFLEEGQWSREQKLLPYWHFFVKRHYEYRPLDFPGIEVAVRALWDEGLLPPVELIGTDHLPIEAPTFDQQKPHLAGDLLDLVLRHLDSTGSFQVQRDSLIALFEEHRTSRTVSEVTHVMTIPLMNFESRAGPTRLADSLGIVRFTAEEKSELWSPFDWDAGFFGIREFASSNWTLRSSVTLPRNQRPDWTELLRSAKLAVTALRLLGSGSVSIKAAIFTVAPPVIQSGQSATEIPDFGAPRLHAPEYVLVPGAVVAFQELHGLLLHLESKKRLRHLSFALRRFNQSFGRERPDDEVIDLAIALDSSIAFGLRQELSFRLSLRGATLLRSRWNPQEVFALLRTLYDVRSKMVHEGLGIEDQARGGKIDGKTPAHFVSETRRVTRDCLGEYVARLGVHDSLSEINKGLETHLLSSLEPAIPK